MWVPRTSRLQSERQHPDMADARDIFLRAIEIESKDERRRYVEAASGKNLDLRDQVLKLLDEFDAPDSRFSKPAARFVFAPSGSGKDGSHPLSDSSSLHGRFLPGTKLADRYRIVSLLGRGGMGEVYRADDLRLGQTVSLKFLPPELAKDAKRLEYFYNEVRLARQLSHPNICRVHDISEADGHHFISMEYIDGEDLKTLLHRIGRIPTSKGNHIAQQICLGLGAAHAKGVLHRDLKPANIMIDGQGQARITDFGLATRSRNGEMVLGLSGTPAYMAPEQLLRGETSIQSDIYSLGLVLFEMFVGKPAHKAKSFADLQRLHEQSSGSPHRSDFGDDIDPAVARAIIRCLESDLANRPLAANEVAAAMPGGDPLAAALSAGETPSPELVAASSDPIALSPQVALQLVLAIVVTLGILLFAAKRIYLVNRLEFSSSPAVMAYHAATLLRRWGYRPGEDSAYGFDVKFRALETSQAPAGLDVFRWPDTDTLPEPGLRFWYRESPRHLYVNDFLTEGALPTRSRVRYHFPAWENGMIGVKFDHKGHLREFRAVPERVASSHSDTAQAPEWGKWFSAADLGFDLTDLEPADWQYPPHDAFDAYASWQGTRPGTDEVIYIHAAAYRGKPVCFEVFHPEDIVSAQSPKGEGPGNDDVTIVVFGFVWFLTILLAYRNVQLGIGDRKSASAVVVWATTLGVLSGILQANHVNGTFEFGVFEMSLASALVWALILGVQYLAIEPFARRYWPESLVAMTRLVRGRWNDTRVGQEILIATLGGVIAALLLRGGQTLGFEPPFDSFYDVLEPPIVLLGVFLDIALTATFAALARVAFLVVFRGAFRSTQIAFLGTAILFTVMEVAFQNLLSIWTLPVCFLGQCAFVWLFVRCGLLSLFTGIFVHNVLDTNLTLDSDVFYFANSAIAITAVLMLAAIGFRITIGRRSIWKSF